MLLLDFGGEENEVVSHKSGLDLVKGPDIVQFGLSLAFIAERSF